MKDRISLYVHIPFCVKKCGYCDFLSGVYDERTQARYVRSLCEEIRFLGAAASGHTVSTVYIGGGTPTWLDLDAMETVLRTLREAFSVSCDAEMTIECNPGTVTADKLQMYRMYGCNRLSIGLQSAKESELRLLGRIHTPERFLHTYDMARKAGFSNINVDLMTGLPGQTLDDLLYTLEYVLRLRPSHISTYALMIEEGTPFFERYGEDVKRREAGEKTLALPDEELEYRLYKMTQYVLEENGYDRYEISNYARQGYACEHNCAYWTRGDYLGLGVGAASLAGKNRGSNVSDLEEYMRRCSLLAERGQEALWQDDAVKKLQADGFVSPFWDGVQTLSRQDEMEEFMFLGLRMNRGVTRRDFEDTFGCRIDGIYGEVLKKLREEEMLVTENGRIFLTERGRDLSNYVLAHFLLGR